MRDGIRAVAIVVLILLGLLSGLIAVWQMLPRVVEETTLWRNSTSRSALGYAGLLALLEQSGFAVTRVTEGEALDQAGGDLLLVTEPERLDPDAFAARLRRPDANVLLIVPKRMVITADTATDRVTGSGMVPRNRIIQLLRALGQEGFPVRPAEDELTRWTLPPGVVEPLIGDLQLWRDGKLEPWAAQDDAILLGQRHLPDGGRLWLLADPDPLMNHGLDDGANVRFALAVFEQVAPGHRIVVDARTLLSGDKQPGYAVLARPPWIALPILVILALVLTGLAAFGRFGAPTGRQGRSARGGQALARRGARLLLAGSDGRRVALLRYLEQAARLVGGRAGDEAALVQRIEAIEAWRLPKLGYQELRRRALRATGRLGTMAAAREIARWRKEMIDERG